MKNIARAVAASISALLLLGLVGCSRTVDDVARWTSNGNIEKLIGALEDPKPAVRKGAADGLGELKAEAAVDPLATLFNDPDSDVLLSGVEALVAIGNDPAGRHLTEALELRNAQARLLATEGLGQIKASHAVAVLVEALDDSDINEAAAASLGLIGDEQASAALAEKLGFSPEPLRLECAKALGNTGGDAAIRGLVPAMSDENDSVRSAAIASLVAIGQSAVPAVLNALQHENKVVRSGAISVLEQTGAVPTEGQDLVWYRLAQVSLTGDEALDMAVVGQLAGMGAESTGTLLEAAAHNSADFRRHAERALEELGESCTAAAGAAATESAGTAGLAWFNERATWEGAPSWRLDLWGATTVLNPKFKPARINMEGLQPEERARKVLSLTRSRVSREYIPLLIPLLAPLHTDRVNKPEEPTFLLGASSRHRERVIDFSEDAEKRLVSTGNIAVFPLIAALDSSSPQIADSCAKLLGEIGDGRAVPPLTKALSRKIDEGKPLSDSPFYIALQKFDDPGSEPLLLKIRPNADRAMRIFERKYQGVRAMSAESRNTKDDPALPITFRLGFITGGTVGELPVCFAKDENGDWVPTPPLPDELSL